MLVNDKNYINIHGWMRTQLNLSGNELLVYALIYGFSQAENQKFTGSLQYIADWCGATKQGIIKNLKSLVEKGLIEKTEVIDNGVKYCEYSCTVLNSVEYPVKLSLTNKLANKQENKTISKDIVGTTEFEFGKKREVVTKQKKPSLYDKCLLIINEFTDDTILQELLIASLKLFLENSRENSTPFYTNTFKGKLNNLKKLSEDNYIQRDIIKQTLDNGWNNFYELKSKSRKSGNARDRIEQLPEVEETTKAEKEHFRRSIKNGQKF